MKNLFRLCVGYFNKDDEQDKSPSPSESGSDVSYSLSFHYPDSDSEDLPLSELMWEPKSPSSISTPPFLTASPFLDTNSPPTPLKKEIILPQLGSLID